MKHFSTKDEILFSFVKKFNDSTLIQTQDGTNGAWLIIVTSGINARLVHSAFGKTAKMYSDAQLPIIQKQLDEYKTYFTELPNAILELRMHFHDLMQKSMDQMGNNLVDPNLLETISAVALELADLAKDAIVEKPVKTRNSTKKATK